MDCCSITDLRNKEVISAKSGCRLGHVSDVEINTCDGKLVAVIVWGRSRCFGLLGRDDDIRICWEDIEVIGADTILVCKEPEKRPSSRKGLFENLFHI
ncbi:MAG: YlmC/YmxH family sporulation protein [Clostridia bacterium]|nr:YlmC/YmxH family sporulation protein [Clostridia bacterium]